MSTKQKEKEKKPPDERENSSNIRENNARKLMNEAPLTFQKRQEWEYLVRKYCWSTLEENKKIELVDLVLEASEYSGAGENAAEKYVRKACTRIGPFEIQVEEGIEYVLRREGWEPGTTQMSFIDQKIFNELGLLECRSRADEKEDAIGTNKEQ